MTKTGKAEPAGALVRYGMVGGGEGAFIGDVHRKAASFDGKAVIAAGCFSRDFAKTLRTGEALRIGNERLYKTFKEMAAAEAQRDDRIDFVIIVTPNSTHYEASKAFLEHGINVVCDKPLTINSGQASELIALAKKKDLLFAVTYTYSGYPAVKQAKAMIEAGEIGEIRFVNAEYPQEWLAEKAEDAGNKQASWRTDPAYSGISNSIGDIGTHVENTVGYITGLSIKRLSARLDTFVKGRRLDDNASVMVDYHGGAKGLYWVSQVAVGCENGLSIRVFGTKGSITWEQEHPDYLRVGLNGKPTMIHSRGRDRYYARPGSLVRLPAGHPEGYFEAFANIYKTYITALVKRANGEKISPDDYDFPSPEEGLRGVRFIETCVASSREDAAWKEFA